MQGMIDYVATGKGYFMIKMDKTFYVRSFLRILKIWIKKKLLNWKSTNIL